MKNQLKTKRRGFTLVELLVVIAIIVGLAAITTPAVFKALGRAAQATTVSNLKDIHKTLTMFAMDNDGLFPSEELATEYAISGSTSSNDLLAQVFSANLLEGDEKLFWVKGSQVCSKTAPDDITTNAAGDFDENETLEAGDVGFAYVSEQTNTDNSGRPLLFDAPLGNSTEFDPDLWGKKVLLLRIGGDATAQKLDPTDNQLKDGNDQNLLDVSSNVWGSKTSIEIAYPEPK